MTRTFVATSAAAQKSNLTIDEMHVNMWFIDRKNVFCDIGMQIIAQKEAILEDKGFQLRCQLPFKCKGSSVLDLYDAINEPNIALLIFNEQRQSYEILTDRVNIERPPYIAKFLSRGKIIICDSGISLDVDSSVNIRVNLTDINHSELNSAFPNDSICFYVRFRFSVDEREDLNIYRVRRSYNEQIHVDFRFNEERLLDRSIDTKSIVDINNVFIFVIKPVYFKLLIDPSDDRRYTRLLETNDRRHTRHQETKKGWKDYLPELERSKERFLIYSWKKNILGKSSSKSGVLEAHENAEDQSGKTSISVDKTPGSRFNMLMAFEGEQKDGLLRKNTLLLLNLFFIAFVFLMLVNPELQNFLNVGFRSATGFVISIIGSIGALAVFIWAFIPNSGREAVWNVLLNIFSGFLQNTISNSRSNRSSK